MFIARMQGYLELWDVLLILDIPARMQGFENRPQKKVRKILQQVKFITMIAPTCNYTDFEFAIAFYRRTGVELLHYHRTVLNC